MFDGAVWQLMWLVFNVSKDYFFVNKSVRQTIMKVFNRVYLKIGCDGEGVLDWGCWCSLGIDEDLWCIYWLMFDGEYLSLYGV